jgi:hypothetical protein
MPALGCFDLCPPGSDHCTTPIDGLVTPHNGRVERPLGISTLPPIAVTGRARRASHFRQADYHPPQSSLRHFEASGREFVSALSDEKLIEMLTEIQSDIRQIKVDLQLLLKQQSKPMPPQVPDRDNITEDSEVAAGSTSVEDVLRYLREKRGDDDLGTD